MKLQKIFKPTYVSYLKNHINPENYALDEFPYDKSQVKTLANIYEPEDLDGKLDPNDSYKSAIALYEAYPNLSPLLASKEEFWVYLTHADCFHYTQRRWNRRNEKNGEESDILSGTATADYIKEHFFYSQRGVVGTTLMNLWWSVYLSVDPSRGEDKKYELTEILFKSEDFRTRRLASSILARNKEAVIGILEFLKENEDVYKNHFEARFVYITKYFNRLSGNMKLGYLNRHFFYEELENHLDVIKSITEREKVFNNDAILSR